VISAAVHSVPCGKVFIDEGKLGRRRFSTISSPCFEHDPKSVKPVPTLDSFLFHTIHITTTTTGFNFC